MGEKCHIVLISITPSFEGYWTSRPLTNSAPDKLGPWQSRPLQTRPLTNSAPINVLMIYLIPSNVLMILQSFYEIKLRNRIYYRFF